MLGILVMNVYAFAMPTAAYGNPLLLGGTEWYNLGIWYVTHVFFDQKFLTIFSLLFGAGLVIMQRRARARGSAFLSIFFRRQLWLLVIGAAHAYLIWVGDILWSYALVGLFACAFRRRSPRALVGIALLLLPVAPMLSLPTADYLSELSRRAAQVSASIEDGGSASAAERRALDDWNAMRPYYAPTDETVREDVAIHRGDYAGIVAHRAPLVLNLQTDGVLVFGIWRIGGLMLLGMALMKLGVLSGERDEAFYRGMLFAGYGLGLPLAAASAWLLTEARWDGIFAYGLGSIPNYAASLLVAAGHVAAVMLIVKRDLLPTLSARFAAVGRMALSNYLMHSLVMTTIFYGYGLGLYGQLPRAAQMALVAAMIAFQLWLSPLWLERYRFGPVEWLWRSLTYGRRQAFRRNAP